MARSPADVALTDRDLVIRLLGGFSVEASGQPVDAAGWRLQKAKTLIKVLALAKGGTLHREQVLDMLWPELEPRAAGNNLRGVVHAARRALGRYGAMASDVVDLQGEWVRLAPSLSVWVDAQAFTTAAAQARKSRDVLGYEAAISLYTGDLLPEDRYDDWASEQRERLRALYLEIVGELAALYEERGEIDRAVEAFQRLLAQESDHAPAREALARLLQVPRRVGAPRHNVPAPLTSFVGREREMDGLQRLLARRNPAMSLVTLIGPGGCGKTRLAGEVAAAIVREDADAFPDGVWLIELATVADPNHITSAVAAALGIREQTDLSLADALLNALSFKRALLVLDNCEHLVEACAAFLVRLLSACMQVRVLATSREVLGVPGETVWRVPPLTHPEPHEQPPIDRLAEYGAVRLFLERARLRDPAFALTAETANAVVQICRQLDGLPLDIELAAARVMTLPIDDLANRLDQRLRLLRGGRRTVAPRHRSLRAAVDWSYDLLDTEEQALFRQLAVFVGGFTVEAAQAVAGEAREAGVAGEEGNGDDEILEVLTRLIEKSMVEPPNGATGRYRLLETLRQYAQERLLETGEEETARGRHAAYFLARAEGAEPRLMEHERERWLEDFQQDLGNIRAALAWYLRSGAPDQALRLAAVLTWFWFLRGHLSEGREWLGRALSADRCRRVPELVRAKALCSAGTLAYMQGDVRESLPLLEEALDLARHNNDARMTALSARHLGTAMLFQGGSPAAEQLLQESVCRYRALGEQWEAAFSLHSWGNAALFGGDLAAARVRYEESLALFSKLDNDWGMALELNGLGNVAFRSGDLTTASCLYQRSLEIRRELQAPWLVANSVSSLADVARQQGDYRRAKSLYREGMLLFRELGDRCNVAACIAALAGLSLDDQARAARLLTAVSELLTSTGAQLEPPDQSDLYRWLEETRAVLGESAFVVAQTLGRAMTLEEMVAETLRDD